MSWYTNNSSQSVDGGSDPTTYSGWGILIGIIVFIISLIIYLAIHIGIVVAGLYVYNKWQK